VRLAKVEALVTKSISGHQTDRMREHYSTVTPDEQRRSISNVVNLFGPRKGGGGSVKSRRSLSAEGLIFPSFLVGAIGIDPYDPYRVKGRRGVTAVSVREKD
jgi:hypothetical protein